MTPRLRALAAALLAAAVGTRAVAGDAPPPAAPIPGADAKARIAAAQEMKKKDLAAFLRSLDAVGAAKPKDPAPDREFLAQYAFQERDRAPRVMALSALERLDKKGAAEWFKGKADGKDPLATVVALDCLGCLGSKEDVPACVALIKNPDEMIAVAAANAAARLADAKDLDEIVDAGLAHPSTHVTNHCAWAVLDVLKKPKEAVKFLEKWVSKKTDPKAVRAAATVTTIRDNLVEPHVWGDTPALARDLMLKAPASVEIKCDTADYKAAVQAGLDWLKKNMPAGELLVRAAAKRIDVPGLKHPDDWLNLDDDAIQIPLDRAAWKPHLMAFHLFWMGEVLWEKRTGEPCKGHRGWEPPLVEVYDLCSIARLYDAGPGGLARDKFVKDQVEKHQWGSQ